MRVSSNSFYTKIKNPLGYENILMDGIHFRPNPFISKAHFYFQRTVLVAFKVLKEQ
tara:strand:- start:19 stop:186 length:168 start_codon:yes stop_codon:yes gene_type:complete